MADDVQKRMEEMRAARAAFNKKYGPDINKAIPMYEDPTRYPIDQLVDLFHTQIDLRAAADETEREAILEVFRAKRDAIQLLPGAPERVYLWKEGNMPAETVYTENPGCAYDHEPDFRPYFLELLIPEDKEPVGAVALVAGGSHGAGTMNECYEVGLEFNALGYQCFILQCRPNMCPWTRLESSTDAARMYQIIRKNAGKYRLKPDRLAYAGFSNGGVTGDGVIEFYSENQKVKDYFPDYVPDEYDEFSGAPDAFLCVYGARHLNTKLSRDNFAYPPVFFAIGNEDRGCMANLKGLLPWLWERNVRTEIHTFAGHPHGYAGWKIIDGKGDYNFDLWITHADVFLRDVFIGYDPKLFG